MRHRAAGLPRLSAGMASRGRSLKPGFTLLLSLSVAAAALALLAACNDERAARRGVTPVTAAVVLPPKKTLTPLPERPLSPELERVRERVMQKASQTRGLNFTRDTGMIELTGWEYGARAKEVADAIAGDDLTELSKLGVAGRMLPEGTNLAALAASFAAVSSGATYSPFDRKVLLMPDAAKDESLLAHEYVHALQDEHFDLLRLVLVRPYDYDCTEALFAVIEGDAMNVQRRIEVGGDAAWSKRSLDDVSKLEENRFNEFRTTIGKLFPPLLTETFVFRYRDGARFVEAVRRARGEKGVDELFTHPPASSAQILHPEKYLAALSGTAKVEPPRDVRVDESHFAEQGWRAGASTPLGEIGVRGVLQAGMGEREAARVASGWNGDRAYLFENDEGQSLFVWQTEWQSPKAAEEFARAYAAALRMQTQRIEEMNAGGNNQTRQLFRDGDRAILIKRDGNQVAILRGANDAVNRES